MTRSFYTHSGWEGKNYDRNLDTKEIAKIIRKELRMFSGCKWSVTSTYNTLNIYLMKAPVSPFSENYNGEDRRGYQLNHYHLDRDKNLTEEAREMFIDIVRLTQSFNYDDSDSQTDYFDTNFYLHLGIGKWNRELEVS